MRIVLIAVSCLLASCSLSLPKFSWLEPYKIEIQQGNMITPEMREKIRLGMSPAMVQSLLGTPLISDPFHPERWDYVYTLQKDGNPAGKQRLTLYFKDEHLMRIDDSGMPQGSAPAPAAGKGAQ